MNSNAVTRIILYSVAIFLLMGLLTAGIGASMWLSSGVNIGGFHFGSGNRIGRNARISSSGSVSAQDVQVVDIQWAAGTITVTAGNVDQIQFSEQGAKNEDSTMVWEQSGKELTIQFSKPQVYIGCSFSANLAEKDLTVTVPKSWNGQKLKIQAASADVVLRDLQVQDVTFQGASGRMEAEGCTVENLDLETASGNIHYTGTARQLECEAVSADITAVLSNTPDSIDLDGVSGDLDITLPKGSGFRVDMDALSGNFSSDFPTTTANGDYISGDGACQINVDAVSGDVRIRQGA